MPALADFSLDYGGSDRDHDRRWSYGEFEHANRHYYYQRHPDVVVVSGPELRHHYQRMDINNDGYHTVDEVRGYRNWN